MLVFLQHPPGAARLSAWLVSCSLILAAGCGALPKNQGSTLEQKQRETVAGKSTADVIESVLSHPTPVKMDLPMADGTILHFEIPETRDVQREVGLEDAEDSQSAAEGSASSWITTPVLISIGVGLLLIVITAWLAYWLLRKFRTVRAIAETADKATASAWQTGNEFIADISNDISARAQAETDPGVSNVLTSLVAAVEKKRANFNAD